MIQILPTKHSCTHTHKRRNSPQKTFAWLHFRNVLRKRQPAISAASTCNKSNSQSQESDEDQQGKTSTNLHLRRSNPPPRMAKGHVVRHAVPLCSLEPILGGHHRHFFSGKKSASKHTKKKRTVLVEGKP